MPSTGSFYNNEVLTQTDLQNAVSLLAASFANLVTRTLYPNAFTLMNGLGVSQTATADNGVQVASGLAYQSGQTLLVATQQGVNILPGSYPNGTGLAADATYSRIDVVYVEYTQVSSSPQTRTFAPTGQTPYTQTVNTQLVDSYTLSVVHGTASSSPVVPSAPAGSVVLAQVTVPANATTITTADIADETAQYRTDGGRLSLATAGLLSYKSATELGTPAGVRLDVGATAYLLDNTTSGKLDIYGGSNGVSGHGAWRFTHSGTPLLVQPTADATTGTHVLSLRNASSTEYAWLDNSGNLSAAAATFSGLLTASAGATVASGQTLTLAGATVAGAPTWSLGQTAPSWVATLTGTSGRFVGATSGSPASGTYAVDDYAVDATNGTLWICTVAGTPGTWAKASPASATPSTSGTVEIAASPSSGSPQAVIANATAAQTVAGPVSFSEQVTLSQPLAAPTNANIVPNPSFRQGSAYWSGVGNNGFVVAPGNSAEGGFLQNNTATTSQTIASQHLPLTASVAIAVSASVDTTGTSFAGGATAYVTIQCFNSSDAYLGQVIAQTTTTAAGQRIGATGTTPAGTAYGIVVAGFSQGAGTITQSGNGTRWSKIKVEAGSAPTAFSDDQGANPATLLGAREFEVAGLCDASNLAASQTTAANGLWPQTMSIIGNASSAALYYFEAVILNSTSGDTTYAALWDVTAGALVAGSTVSTTNNVATVLRSGAIALVAGHTYEASAWVSAGTGTLAKARIVGVL